MKIQEAKENVIENFRRLNYPDHHEIEVFLLNTMEQLEGVVKDEFEDELKQRNRIIAVLLDKLGGQARVFDYELLNLPEKADVIGEVSRADNSTLFTLKK